jgi:hypothetical protein
MAANMTNDLYFFFIEIENFRGEGKILMRHTHDTTFSEKILDFSKILEESEQFFILFLKKMENIMRFLIMPNSRMQRKLSVLQKKSDHIRVPEK